MPRSQDPADDPSVLTAVLDLVIRRLDRDAAVTAPTSSVRAEVERRGVRVVSDEGPADVALLVAGELGRGGAHAETLLSDTVDAVRPGGQIAVHVANAFAVPATDTGPRAWRPSEVERLFGGRGVALEGLWSPGAAARVGGLAFRLDDRADADPHLLGAGRTLVALGRTPGSPRERSRVFFSTLPRKAVASATLVRHPTDGRLLLVFDAFKRRWTIPGGVVDADEDPEHGAVRETHEEAGLAVRLTGLAGVFHATRPDRVLFVFTAEPTGGLDPAPVHRHEVAEAAWTELGDALRLVAPHTAEQIRRGLQTPGRVWRQ